MSQLAPSRWTALSKPVRALVWLLIALATVVLYEQAHDLIVHLAGIALLFVFAGIIALLLTPVIDWLSDLAVLGRHRSLATILVYSVLLGAVAGLIALVVPALISQVQQLPALIGRAQDLLAQAQQTLADHGIPVHLGLPTSGAPVLATSIAIALGTLSTVVNIVLVVVISIYFSIQGRQLIAGLRQLFPERAHLFDFTLLAVGTTVGAYARGQLILATIMGAYTGTVMTLIGVHYSVLLGVGAFFLEFIPLFGAPVVMILAALVALFQSPTLALVALIAGVVGHALEAYIVGPRVTGHVTQLHPLAAMAALLIGADLQGLLGALFAVPLASLGNVLLGALYRSRQGDHALSTGAGGEVTAENLPRLGEEIGAVDDDVSSEPVSAPAEVPHDNTLRLPIAPQATSAGPRHERLRGEDDPIPPRGTRRRRPR